LIEFTEDEVRPERLEEGKKILRKLLGDKTSFVAKRQCMRANFGDYRTDMKSWRTLEHGRSKLGKINKALVEYQLGLEIPYEYESPSSLTKPLKGITVFKYVTH